MEIRDAGRGPAAAAGFARRSWPGVAVARPAPCIPGRGREDFFRRRLLQPIEKARSAVRNGSEIHRKIEEFLANFGAPGAFFAHPARFLKSGGRLRGGRDRSRAAVARDSQGEGLEGANARKSRRKPLESLKTRPNLATGQLPLLARAAARIWLSVVVGVIASGSIFTWMIEGRPEPSARSNAGRNSAVSSTVSPWPPKARA